MIGFQFEGLLHLVGGVIVDDQQATQRLRALVQEMDTRYKRFKGAKANNITSFNAQDEPNLIYAQVPLASEDLSAAVIDAIVSFDQ